MPALHANQLILDAPLWILNDNLSRNARMRQILDHRSARFARAENSPQNPQAKEERRVIDHSPSFASIDVYARRKPS